jgi:GDP-D-mannose dehydratase
MHLSLQAMSADDYLIATGQITTAEDSIDEAFKNTSLIGVTMVRSIKILKGR